MGGWEGYRVGVAQRFPPRQYGPKAEAWIDLVWERSPFVCSGCGRWFDRYHDWEERWVRELPILDAETRIHLQRFRVDCPDCGRVVEQLPWLAKHARETRRLTESVARPCRFAPIKHAAEFYGPSWDTVKRIDKACLQEQLGEPGLSNLRLSAMDKFAVKRGHRYATIFVEPQRKEVLWVCRGRSREDIRPFFETLGDEGRRQIEAVAMDMNGAYEAEVRVQCPPKRSAEYLFEIIIRRYQVRSTIMTSNRPLENRGKLIGDIPAATAILDRFLHNADVISITAKSYRMKDQATRSQACTEKTK